MFEKTMPRVIGVEIQRRNKYFFFLKEKIAMRKFTSNLNNRKLEKIKRNQKNG